MLNHATATSIATPAYAGSLADRTLAAEQLGPARTWDEARFFTASATRQPVIDTTCDESGRPLTASLLAWAPDVELL
jgi:hypothetical protein